MYVKLMCSQIFLEEVEGPQASLEILQLGLWAFQVRAIPEGCHTGSLMDGMILVPGMAQVAGLGFFLVGPYLILCSASP